ncbi:MAG TPA: helix-turn-helix transcriptional regulator [Ktedonosporobacter sp.]|nr:helix-turn-helix transcriptional regulator [Ktedonosporobacter sp.]
MIRLKVKEIAEQQGFSQSKLSRKADVDLTTLRKIYQQPTTANVTIETLDRLAKALEVDIRELLESIPDEDKDE